MSRLISLKSPVIVEGKYDKITLENVIDATIIATDGFRIFKDYEKCEMIRRLAQKNGIIVMTDSDSAGALIRSYIKKIVGDCEIINVYVPTLSGKEKRKTTPSKEGILGVEGMTVETIRKSLERSGVFAEKTDKKRRKITKNDMYLLGFSGTSNSSEKRKNLLKELDLPLTLSSGAMLDVLNNLYTYEEFCEVARNFQKSEQ